MNVKKVALTLAICIALNGLWFYDAQNRSIGETNALIQSRFLPVDAVKPEEYTRLEIVNSIAPDPKLEVLEIDLNFDSKKSTFQVIKPFNRPGDGERIVRLFDNLSNARRGNIFEGTPDDGNGLTSPTVVLRLDHRSSEIDSPWVLEVGRKSDYTGQYFARANDAPTKIFTISQAVYNRLLTNPLDYIDLRLMDVPTADDDSSIKSITINNGHGEVKLIAGADSWRAVGEYEGPADEKAIQDFVDALERRRAASTLEPDPRLEFGETEALVQVFDGATTRALEIGGPHPMDPNLRLAKRDDLDYYLVLTSDAHQSFQVPPLHWVERTLIPFDPAGIGRIVIKGPVRRVVPGERGTRAAQELQIVKNPSTDGWFIAGRPNRVLAPKKFVEFLKLLGGLRADGVVPFSGDKLDVAQDLYFGPGDHIYLVEEATEKGADADATNDLDSASFQISRTSETQNATTFVRRGNEQMILRLKLETAVALRVEERDLLFPFLFGGINEKVERLVLRGPEGEVELKRRRDPLNPGWDHPKMTTQYSDEIGERIMSLSFAEEGQLPSVIGVAGKPKWSIEAFDDKDKKIEHLKVFEDDLVKDSLLLPLTAEDGTLLPIKRDQLDRLNIFTRRALDTGTDKPNPFNLPKE